MRGGHWRKLANDIQGISSESKKFTMNILKVRNKKKENYQQNLSTSATVSLIKAE
jgi:hypothetical protein